jgi:hypothetical protein
MKASVGDRIVIASATLDRPVRDGRIVEVRHADGSPPYVVEWSDNGQQGLVFPGPDARVVSPEHEVSPEEPAVETTAGPERKRSWVVTIDLAEIDKETRAHAVLVGEPLHVDAEGTARRRPGEADVPQIGDEIAVARALRRLSDLLLGAAQVDLTAADVRRQTLPG